MFYPIGDDQVRNGYKPIFTYLLILTNILLFFYQLTLTDEQLSYWFREYGATPTLVLHGQTLKSLITGMFLHGGWMHLIGNMLFLWVFADNIEAIVGTKRFILFYFAGGVFAALVHSLINRYSGVPCIGASGAISAALGAYLVMFPGSKIKMLVFIWVFRISAFFFLGFWIIQQLLAGYRTFDPIMVDDGIGYWAHIGGFAYGFIAGFSFRKYIQKHHS